MSKVGNIKLVYCWPRDKPYNEKMLNIKLQVQEFASLSITNKKTQIKIMDQVKF